ncbi:class I SAM-dependent methyltransferase [Bosea sp. NPDC055594]
MSAPAKPYPEWAAITEAASRNNDLGYGDFVVAWPLDYYRRRLRQIGMTGYDRVLDVGCGFGQWSAALACENGSVVALEIHQKRLETTRALSRSLGLDTVAPVSASGSSLPFADASFDALFCYGVYMFLDRTAAISEFQRVLKPGGRLYICSNGPGWWLKLAVEHFRKNRDMSRIGWHAFLARKRDHFPNSTTVAEVPRWFPAPDWRNIRAAAEGALVAEEPALRGDRPEPVYAPRYLGFDNVIEWTADRAGEPIARRRAAEARVDAMVEATLAEDRMSHQELLERFPMPRPATDSVNNRNALAVGLTLESARALDRTATLRKLFSHLTAGCASEADKRKACIAFAQRHFYHHFAGQAMKGPGEVVSDPIASLLLRACRCGNAARFLIDLFAANGISARLIGGACHSTAEVELDGRFVLAEANLYPPGVIPLNAAGEWASLEDAAQDPALLDRPPSYANYNAAHIDAFRQAYPEAYEPIARWLEAPILPSVAFFGAEFFAGRTVSLAQRWIKRGDAREWEADVDYGWNAFDAVPGVQGPELATAQRPGQVRSLWRDGQTLRWTPPASAEWAPRPRYRIHVARHSRGWHYGALAADTDFAMPGEIFHRDEPELELPAELRTGEIFVSVVAEARDMTGVFNLPSEEFVV